jgi:hypothetical protein
MLYFKIDPTNNSILGAINGDFINYNTKNTSALNGKAYLVEVTVTDPSHDSATQVKEGPVDAYDGNNATRVYTIRSKTQEELDANRIRYITPREFHLRLTLAEQTTISAACMSDPEVFMWRLAAAEAEAGRIDLQHPDTLTGLQLLVSKGLLTSERIPEILA